MENEKYIDGYHHTLCFCAFCGAEKWKRTARLKDCPNTFCSTFCNSNFKKRGKNVKCSTCGVEFYKTLNQILKNAHHFCGHTCSAIYSNKNRQHSDETKEKISKALIGKPSKFKGKIGHGTKGGWANSNLLYKCICQFCGNSFEIIYSKRKPRRKTCSSDCRTQLIFKDRKYQNGSRLTIKYQNKIQGEVTLESTWELKIAELLDDQKINWIRPDPIPWNDGSKNRLYFPDFYLPEFDIYLDPKNPYCLLLDKQKLAIIEKKIDILYGDIKILENLIERLR